MASGRLSLVLLLVFAQCLIIAALISRGPGYAASVHPISRDDVRIATSSDRLKHYYDLSGEIHTFVPEWLPYTPVYERNADRLNDRFDYALEKPEGTYRIVTLGDSWTFGLHVSTKDNYSERLEDMLNGALGNSLRCEGVTRFEVINLGLGGYDIEYMIESLRLRGMPYGPDLAVPLIKNDDFVVVNELWQPKIAAYQEEMTDLDAKIVDGAVRNPRQEIAERVVREITAEHPPEQLDARGMDSLRFLDTFYDGKLLLLVYAVSDTQRESLRSYAASRASTWVREEPLLRSDEKVPHDEHPGKTGHARFAESLFDTLIGQRIIPCRTVS